MEQEPEESKSAERTTDGTGKDIDRGGSEKSTQGTATNGGWTDVAQDHYDPGGTRDLTTVVISAIAKAEGVSITEVRSPPLYEIADIAAIEEAMFGRSRVSQDGTGSAFEFRYNEHVVRVEADGWVTVSESSAEPAVT